VPHWIDGALKKALKVNPDSRYPSMSEFIYDLEHPNAALTDVKFLPFIEKDPVKFWQTTSLLLTLLSIALLALLLKQ